MFSSRKIVNLIQLTAWIVIASFASAQAHAHHDKSVTAKSYVVMNLDGTIVLEKNGGVVRPIASITKLLVAEQIIDYIGNSNVKIQRSNGDVRSRKLQNGAIYSDEDLLRLALISSDNEAIIKLSASLSINVMEAVNQAAKARNLNSIHIEEPSGLSRHNVASARDLAMLAIQMRGSIPAQVSIERNVTMHSGAVFGRTNPLIGTRGWNFELSKTGFINEAGGCMVVLVEIAGRVMAVAILGSNNVRERWRDLGRIRSHLDNTKFFNPANVPTKTKKTKRNKVRA